MKLFFQLLYHQLAWTYDLVAAVVSVGMWKSWVLSTLPYLESFPPGRILEVGHGPGHLQKALRGRGIDAYGLDESSQMGRIAFRRNRRKGIFPRLVNGYAQFMCFPDHTFAQVVSTFPSEYLIDPKTLSEIYRVLAPGGRLLILPAAWITGRRWHHRLAAALFRLTGQVPHWDPSLAENYVFPPLLAAGFSPRIELVDLPASRLLFVDARKPTFD
jgi:ubiquinone/menaquinone biosynthesis C-methylase UbiE